MRSRPSQSPTTSPKTPSKSPTKRFIWPLLSVIILVLAASIRTRLVQTVSQILPSSLYTTYVAMSYQSELRVAELAVQRASLLTQRVFFEKAKGTVSKDDTSPVTKGDFGAQALIIQAIRKNFPADEIVAEEEASSLKDNAGLRSEIWNSVKETRLTDAESDALLGGVMANDTEMLDMIDAGGSAGGPKGRVWALDPIDGTKGFLRGGQYAVCLALIEDGDIKVGVIGCPNLPVSDSAPLTTSISEGVEKGVLFSTVKGEGAKSRPLSTGALQPRKPISMRAVPDTSKAVFCEGVEAAHTAQDDNAQVARRLGISSDSVRLDSQAKYCSIARGAGDIYLRLPVKKDYQEKIWDHAAGDLLVREAGGMVSDINGKRLDFSIGRKLVNNKGVVAAPASLHPQVIDAVKAVYASKV